MYSNILVSSARRLTITSNALYIKGKTHLSILSGETSLGRLGGGGG